jgi:hypothetical protein
MSSVPNRLLTVMRFCLLTVLQLTLSAEIFAQSTAVNNLPPANYDASYAVQYIRHEIDNQNQILIPVTPNLSAAYTCTAGCLAGWSVTIGGSPATISSVVGANGAGNVIVTLSGTAPLIGIGQTVLVSYSGGGPVLNNFINRQSYNARQIDSLLQRSL